MGAQEISRAESRGSILLWFGVLAGPLAWTLQLAIDYMLEEFIACTPGARDQGQIWGLSVDVIALVVSGALTAVTGLGGVVALSCLRKIRSGGDPSMGGRAGWMAIAGIMNSILFGVLILASFAPPLLLDVCRPSL